MIARGDVCWVDLEAEGEGDQRPARRRPVLVVQEDAYNRSRISTVIVAVVTSNLGSAGMPGHVMLSTAESGLPRDSVVNVTQLLTIRIDTSGFAVEYAICECLLTVVWQLPVWGLIHPGAKKSKNERYTSQGTDLECGSPFLVLGRAARPQGGRGCPRPPALGRRCPRGGWGRL